MTAGFWAADGKLPFPGPRPPPTGLPRPGKSPQECSSRSDEGKEVLDPKAEMDLQTAYHRMKVYTLVLIQEFEVMLMSTTESVGISGQARFVGWLLREM